MRASGASFPPRWKAILVAVVATLAAAPQPSAAVTPGPADTLIAVAGDSVFVFVQPSGPWALDSVPDDKSTIWSYLYTSDGEWAGAATRLYSRPAGSDFWTETVRPASAKVESLAFHQGRVYALAENTLFRLESQGGETKWTDLGKPWPGHTARGLASLGPDLYIAVGDSIYSWDGAAFKLEGTPGPVLYSMASAEGGLIVGLGNGSVMQFEVRDATFTSLGEPKGSGHPEVLLAGGGGFYASVGKNIYRRDASSGEWSIDSTPSKDVVHVLAFVPALPPPNRAPTVTAVEVLTDDVAEAPGPQVTPIPGGDKEIRIAFQTNDDDGWTDILTASVTVTAPDGAVVFDSITAEAGSAGERTLSFTASASLPFYKAPGLHVLRADVKDRSGAQGSLATTFEVVALLGLSLDAGALSFGAGELVPESTTHDSPSPIRVRNVGNVPLDLDVSATDLAAEGYEANIPANRVHYSAAADMAGEVALANAAYRDVAFDLLPGADSGKTAYFDLHVPSGEEQYVPAADYRGAITIGAASG